MTWVRQNFPQSLKPARAGPGRSNAKPAVLSKRNTRDALAGRYTEAAGEPRGQGGGGRSSPGGDLGALERSGMVSSGSN
jgi:hypothetical protein